MSYLNKLLAAASAALFIASSALAQNAGTVTNHAFIIGKGAGTTGYTSLLCGSAQLAVGQAAADPICQTITGDVTISAGGVTAIGATKVLNSMLAAMAANTTKCNATAGSAVPTDCSASTMRTNIGVVIGTNVQAWDADLDCIAALATTGQIKRTGAGTCSAGAVALSDLATGTQDTVIGYFGSTTSSAVAISNCTGALTYSTATHTFGCNAAAGTGTVTSAQVSAGAGISVSGTCTITTTGNCTVAQSLTNATLSGQPTNPVATTSAAGVMMGLGVTTCRITPTYSSRVFVVIDGSVSNSSIGNIASFNLRFGTGAGPANGAAATGTVVSSTTQTGNGGAVYQSGFSKSAVITGLTPGTAIWLDVNLGATAGTSTMAGIGCTAYEF